MNDSDDSSTDLSTCTCIDPGPGHSILPSAPA